MGVVKEPPSRKHVAIDVLFTDTRNTYFPMEKAGWVMQMLADHFMEASGAFASETTDANALVMGFGDDLLASMLLEVPDGWSAEKFVETVEFRWFEIFMQRNDVLIEEGCEIEEEGAIAKAYPVTPDAWASSFSERRGLFSIMFCDEDLLERLAMCVGRKRKIWTQLPA